jgi:hypothetical protein
MSALPRTRAPQFDEFEAPHHLVMARLDCVMRLRDSVLGGICAVFPVMTGSQFATVGAPAGGAGSTNGRGYAIGRGLLQLRLPRGASLRAHAAM